MAKGGKVVIVGGIAALALYFINKGAKSAKLEYYFNSISLNDLSLQNFPGRIKTKLSVVNPSNTSQVVDAVFANVYLPNGTQLGRIEQTTPQTIAPRGTSVLEMPVILFAAGMGEMLAYVVKKQIPTIKIKGTIVSMGISIPFEQTL